MQALIHSLSRNDVVGAPDHPHPTLSPGERECTVQRWCWLITRCPFLVRAVPVPSPGGEGRVRASLTHPNRYGGLKLNVFGK